MQKCEPQRTQEEPFHQERCVRREAWDLAKDVYKLKKEEKVTFYYPAEVGVLPAPSSKKPEEREFGIDTILIFS